MAGAGFKTFVDGDVLTAAEVNTYLMQQSVMVFATAAARTSGIASPSEGMVTYRSDANVLEFYDGSSWQPVAPTSTGVTLGFVLALGGD